MKRQASAQAAITDSTGSSATTTLVTVRNDTTAHAASDAQDNDHVLFTLLNARIRTRLAVFLPTPGSVSSSSIVDGTRL